ncbi:hypothetical protein FYK55_20870 [Roseiconus nitratireducens]|uniref:Uncharacterized protein n=1 Tax=Roseiconus nitratireducens TaxID=2605748 RepID=A0A5M6D031_9BACT|nr:hypothetical protein [Roseiconus nitratireducens]KAA5540466.1 hypothetical protein FYK55_20870 [Roseiconus nitratireducens]
MIDVYCSGCSTTLKAPAELAGKRVACPKCKTPLTIPTLPESAAQAEAQPAGPAERDTTAAAESSAPVKSVQPTPPQSRPESKAEPSKAEPPQAEHSEPQPVTPPTPQPQTPQAVPKVDTTAPAGQPAPVSKSTKEFDPELLVNQWAEESQSASPVASGSNAPVVGAPSPSRSKRMKRFGRRGKRNSTRLDQIKADSDFPHLITLLEVAKVLVIVFVVIQFLFSLPVVYSSMQTAATASDSMVIAVVVAVFLVSFFLLVAAVQYIVSMAFVDLFWVLLAIEKNTRTPDGVE